jgi:glutamine amidotransferase
VGLQVLFEGSEETPGAVGLGVLPGRVVRFDVGNLKVPHMGWNELEVMRPHPVLDGLQAGAAFYFVHSYHPVPEKGSDVLGVADYGGAFCAVAGRENLVAVQFHPEKSSRAGLKLYENFLLWARGL